MAALLGRARPVVPATANAEMIASQSEGVVAPPKLRRRPAMVAGAVALTCTGALLGTWAYLGISEAQSVVAMRTSVERGALIERGDLVTARINADPALRPVPISEALSLVGKRAAVDLPAGALVTRDAVTSAPVPSAGFSVVGLGLEPGLLPGGDMRTGDRVRVVAAPSKRAGQDNAGEAMLEVAAEVSAVHRTQTSNTVVVDVVVPQAQAAKVAAAAAAGEVAVVLDSRER